MSEVESLNKWLIKPLKRVLGQTSPSFGTPKSPVLGSCFTTDEGARTLYSQPKNLSKQGSSWLLFVLQT